MRFRTRMSEVPRSQARFVVVIVAFCIVTVSCSTDPNEGTSSRPGNSVGAETESEVVADAASEEARPDGEDCVQSQDGDGWIAVTQRLGGLEDSFWPVVAQLNLSASANGVLLPGQTICISTAERAAAAESYEPPSLPDVAAPPAGDTDGNSDSDVEPVASCGNPFRCVSWVSPSPIPSAVADADVANDEGDQDASGIVLGDTAFGASAPGSLRTAFAEADWEEVRNLYAENHVQSDVAVTAELSFFIYAIGDLEREIEVPRDVQDHYCDQLAVVDDAGSEEQQQALIDRLACNG